jgi:hypothetical protein
VVVVNVGHIVLVVVVTVVAVQQKFRSPGESCTSFGLQASRIFTVPLKVPVREGLAHSTAPCATTGTKMPKIAAATIRIESPPCAGYSRPPPKVNAYLPPDRRRSRESN